MGRYCARDLDSPSTDALVAIRLVQKCLIRTVFLTRQAAEIFCVFTIVLLKVVRSLE